MPHFSRKLLHSINCLHHRPTVPPPPPPPATPLTALPNELLLLIAELLPPASLNSLLRCSHHLFHLLTPLLHKYVLRDWHTTTRVPETHYVSAPALLYAAFRGYHGLARIVLSNQPAPGAGGGGGGAGAGGGATSCLEARCPRGLTALHWATRNGDEAMVRLLLAHGAHVDATDDNFGETPLHSAAHMGHPGIIALLLRHGAEINKLSFARATPFAGAVKRVAVDAVALLLDRGAAPPLLDRRGETPLHWAAEFGSVELVRVLLRYPVFEVGASNYAGRTPLHWAVMRTSHAAQVVGLLLQEKADVNYLDVYQKSPVYYALNELLKEYQYKNSKAPDRRKREAVVRLLFEQNPQMEKHAISALKQCWGAVGMFSKFRVFLENAMVKYVGLRREMILKGRVCDLGV